MRSPTRPPHPVAPQPCGARYGGAVRAEEVDRYRGQWVAVDRRDDLVVMSADTLEDLKRRLVTEPHGRVLVHRVSRADEPIFLGVGLG